MDGKDVEDTDSPKGLSQLEGHTWDAVVDTSGYAPRIVKASAEFLSKSVKQYVFISSISAYKHNDKVGADETSPVGTMADEMEPVHRIGTSRMHGVNDVLDDLDTILVQRAEIQSWRQVPDHVVFASFGKPLEPLGNDGPPYVATLDKVARFLGIDVPARYRA